MIPADRSKAAPGSAIPTATTAETGPLLRVDGVTPQYKTRQRLVTATCRVSIDVHSAGRQALLEPAGCGKSTLLNAACAYTATTDGAMTL